MSNHSPDSVSSGTLFIVPTPIGNLEDISIRALKILKQVDFIACEDTRHTRKLLNRYQLHKKLLSYYQPREKEKIPKILASLQSGHDIALVSDAGTPGISDPGFLLVRAASEQGIRIVSVPGACALTTAVAASGLPADRFLFLGFPPVKSGAVNKLLSELKDENATLVFYLPPRKIGSFLLRIQESLGERRVVIARELTKLHEEYLRGTPTELLYHLADKTPRGEITLLIEGYTRRIRKHDQSSVNK